MLDPRRWAPPVAIAHRGSRELWPENTMIAFEAAVSLGARHLETDVRVSGDGVVHCFHDQTIDRTTEGSGPLVELSSAEIAALDAGFNHATPDGFSFRGVAARIPTFEELATSFPDVQIVADMKEDHVVEPLAALVGRLGIEDRLVVGSFSDVRLQTFRELTGGSVATSTGSAESRAWVLASRVGRGIDTAASALQLPLQMRGLRVVDEKLVAAAHERGLQVHAWTINDVDRIEDLIHIGVDGIVTDRIDLALDLLGA